MKYIKMILVLIVSLMIANTTFASVSCDFSANNSGLTPGNTSSLIAEESLSSGTWSVPGAESVEFTGASYRYDYELDDWIVISGTEWTSNIDSVNSVTKSGSDFGVTKVKVSGLAVVDSAAVAFSCPDVSVYGKLVSNSCTVPVSTAVMNHQTVEWMSHASGGDGSYTVTWSGDQDISSLTSTVAGLIYTTIGDKNASVTGIVSGDGQSWTGTTLCDGPVSVMDDSISGGGSDVPTPIGDVSCAVSSASVNVGDTVTWNAIISGGQGPFSVNWSGVDSFVGEEASASIVYTTMGTKTANFDMVVDSAGEIKAVSVSCPSVTVNATSTDNGGDTDGGSTSGGRRSSSRVIVVEDNATSTDQADIDNLVAWLRNNPDLFSTLPQEIVALNLENPIASTTLATNDNGTSSTSTVASSTESENNLAAAAATALGSAAKYAWYIAGIILLGLIGWFVFFLLKRRNKKDKIS